MPRHFLVRGKISQYEAVLRQVETRISNPMSREVAIGWRHPSSPVTSGYPITPAFIGPKRMNNDGGRDSLRSVEPRYKKNLIYRGQKRAALARLIKTSRRMESVVKYNTDPAHI